MSLKLISLHGASTVRRNTSQALPEPLWLLNHLKATGHLSDAHDAWHAWPTLETATAKLARLFGQGLKTHNGKNVTIDAVVKAVLAFKVARLQGSTLTSAATEYVSELLKTGELIINNRIESSGPDSDGEVALWDMSLGPFDDWVRSLPDGHTVSVHQIDAFEGEYKAGRVLVAGLILTATDYACLVYPSASATRGDM